MMRVFVLLGDLQAATLHAFLKANRVACAEAGKPLTVTVTDAKPTRSSRANRRHWAIMRQIAEEAWFHGKQFDDETWHRYFCGEFIGKVEMPDGTFTYESSAKLDVAEFAAFDAQIEAFAASILGITFTEDLDLGRAA